MKPNNPDSEKESKWIGRPRYSIVVLLSLFCGCTGAICYLLGGGGQNSVLTDYIFPVLAVLCVVDVVVMLGILAYTYDTLGLANNNQALGLPEGSIRAVIAIILLVLFGGISVFLYQHSSREQDTRYHLTTAQKEDVVKGRTSGTFVAYREIDEKPATDPTVKPDPNAAEMKWTVVLYGESPASSDLAKQILTTLATLVTTLVGFYFGAGMTRSASADAAQQAKDQQPVLNPPAGGTPKASANPPAGKP